MAALITALIVLLSSLSGVSLGEEGEPLADEPVEFEDVTEEAGFGDINYIRVAWGDYDGDGWEDLLLNGRSLWRNNQDGTFTDVTADAGIRGVNSNGGVWADYDNDGDLDFYATVHSFEDGDVLWRNEGDGTFIDITSYSGEISDRLPTEGAAWGDYDDDGYVDLYVANYETASGTDDPLGIGTPDVLYHNNGDGTFSNVSREAGVELDGEPMVGRGVAWCDFDDDGDLDIYVSNYRLDPNFLWRNDGDGTFTDVAKEQRVQGYATEAPAGGPRYGHTIGSDWGDYDNDGDMDLYASNLAHPRFIMFSDKPMLLENRRGTFLERWPTSGIDYCETSSDPAWGDYDNDGDLDLYFTAIYDGRYSRLFRGAGNGRFEDATEATGTTVNNGWGCAWCDYDHDGDLDLAVGSGSGFRLFRNGGNSNDWFQVELRGEVSNAAAIGARVRVDNGDRAYYRDVQGGRGTTSQNMLACHFGLPGSYSEVEVAVRWPGSTEYIDVGTFAVNQRIIVSELDIGPDPSVRLSADPEIPRVGDVVTLSVTVYNGGEGRMTAANVRLASSDPNHDSVSFVFGPLDPMQAEQQVTLWQPTKERTETVWVQILQVDPFDTDGSNNYAEINVTVMGVNQPPFAKLRADPTTVPPGVAVTFDGSASTDDDRVVLYYFEFGDGNVSEWQASPTTTHVYRVEGELLASLTVRDEAGTPSVNFATVIINVTRKGFRPGATILDISPELPRVGMPVTLRGAGTPAEGATIVAHSWESSIDGHLGDEAELTVSTLSQGVHTIIYKVRDDRDIWSQPETAELEVLPPEGDWTIGITEPAEGETLDFGPVTFRGKAAYTAGPVEYVEVRVDNGEWMRAEGNGIWSLRVNLSGLEPGIHTFRARAHALASDSHIAYVNFTLGEEDADGAVAGLGDWLLENVFLLALLLVVVVLLLAIARASRKRRPRGIPD